LVTLLQAIVTFFAIAFYHIWCFQHRAVTTFNINTLTSGLIQAVRRKTAGSHVALRVNISALVSVTELVEGRGKSCSLHSKNIFLVMVCGFLWVMS